MSIQINGTTGISGVAGSVSAPMLTGDDANCGISFPSADTIKFSTGGVERMQITDSGVSGTGLGKILQVVSTTKTDTFSATAIPEGDHTGAAISVTITPTSATSKVFIMASLNVGLDNDNEVSFAFFRGGSILTGAIGDAAGNRTRTGFGGKCESTSATEGLSGHYLDSPNTTSATTYDCRLSHGVNAAGNRTMYLNRSHTDTDADQDSRFASTITVVEVAA